jgi:hypothetical protein
LQIQQNYAASSDEVAAFAEEFAGEVLLNTVKQEQEERRLGAFSLCVRNTCRMVH